MSDSRNHDKGLLWRQHNQLYWFGLALLRCMRFNGTKRLHSLRRVVEIRLRGIKSTLLGESSSPTRYSGRIGLALGVAAAIVGVESPSQGFPLRPWHILVLVALALALFSRLKDRTPQDLGSMRVLLVDVAFLMFIAGGAAIELFNGARFNYTPQLNQLIEPVFWCLGYLSARIGIRSRDSAVRALKAFIAPIFLIAPISLAQSLNVGPVVEITTRFVTSDGFERRLESGGLLRAVGLIGGWTSLGAYASGIFAMALALILDARQSRRRSSAFGIIASAFCLITLVTTLTFSVVLAFGVILIGCMKRLGLRPGMMISIGTGALIAVVALRPLLERRLDEQFDRYPRYQSWLPDWVPNTLAFRTHVWVDQTVPAMAEHGWLGWGRGVYEAVFRPQTTSSPERVTPTGLVWTSPESQWFAMVMTAGIVGLIFLLILVAGQVVIVRAGSTMPQISWLIIPTSWLLLSNIAIGFTATTLTNKGITGVLWPLIGIIAALTIELGQPRSPTPRARFSVSNGVYPGSFSRGPQWDESFATSRA